MRLFLKWSLLNVLFVLALAVVAERHAGEVDGLARWFVVGILAVFAASSAYGGLLCWRWDSQPYGENGLGLVEVNGNVAHVELAADMCQYLGLLGAATGFLVALSGDQLSSVQDRVAGASIGLAATAVGVACSMVLLVEAHLLRQS